MERLSEEFTRREFLRVTAATGGFGVVGATVSLTCGLGTAAIKWLIRTTSSETPALQPRDLSLDRQLDPAQKSLKRELPESEPTLVAPKTESDEALESSEELSRLQQIGYFPELKPELISFSEDKYPLPEQFRGQSAGYPWEWREDTRHLPIKVDREVFLSPSERSSSRLEAVVSYTGFDSPRYTFDRFLNKTFCNIAVWDWSNALSLHLPHWLGNKELSANSLHEWLINPKGGGVEGEGWQPSPDWAAKDLASRGVPVFASAYDQGRTGHLAMVVPSKGDSLLLASVGRKNGVFKKEEAFGRLAGQEVYFVHTRDFVVDLEN